MGTLINALKEIFSGSSQTRPTNIPTCASNGTPNGNSTVQNLAAALGSGAGLSITADNDTNANTLPLFRAFSFATQTSIAEAKNFPVGAGVIFTMSAGNGCTLQICSPTNTSDGFYARCQWGNNWSAWNKISVNIPTFYKDYANLGALASALGVINSNYFVADWQDTAAEDSKKGYIKIPKSAPCQILVSSSSWVGSDNYLAYISADGSYVNRNIKVTKLAQSPSTIDFVYKDSGDNIYIGTGNNAQNFYIIGFIKGRNYQKYVKVDDISTLTVL